MPDSRPLRIALSAGEPAGIGPELLVQLAHAAPVLLPPVELIAIADPELLRERARHIQLPLQLQAVDWQAPTQSTLPGELRCLPQPPRLHQPSHCGQLDPRNAPYVLECLERAVTLCQHGQTAALVTAPIQKSCINEAGIPFTGHTEWLAERLQTPDPVMLLVADQLRVALATTHLPLAAVPAAITPALLEHIITRLHHGLIQDFAISMPRIGVTGLNPHAGESGHLGDEELRIITPTLQRLRQQGLQLSGPLPADTLFTPHSLQQFDAVLCMYHDQGLPVLKYAGFGHAVNITLGLPIVRTSVDHGTALTLAGTGTAAIGSLHAAVVAAAAIATRRLAASA